MNQLVHYIGNMLDIKGPKLLHVITQKGKGFTPAENDPVGYHALNKIEPKKPRDLTVGPHQDEAPPKILAKKYQDIFGDWLCDIGEHDPYLIGITPAMCEGSLNSGLSCLNLAKSSSLVSTIKASVRH